ncbi:peroxiredoxin-4-like [Glomus cerebriforme]|uniref:thioredoxin-dependent peroxiredoxin n=1 Tax=Glomus cerebriforme TaxID=658196 RepID=A0A397TI48_9GLOM|nr:peroxiredoxin-4-like [Glomus cerebriforme]
MFALSTRSLSTRIISNAAATTSLKLTQRKFSVGHTLYKSDFTSSVKEVSNLIKRKFADNEIARVASPAPFWEAKAVVDGDVKTLSLRDFASKYLVMIFYPLDFTFVCPTELIAFSDRVQEFRDINTEVVGISCDSPHAHIAWDKIPRNQGGLGGIKIPLIADLKKEITKRYGCLYEETGFPFRGTYIIDDKGKLRVAHINDTEIGRSVDETLRLVKAIQFTNEHGEVCPANWKSGDRTIIPDPKKAKEYFAQIK